MRALRTRLLLGAAAFIALALMLAAAGLILLFERHVKSWIDAELNSHLDQLISGIDRDPTGTLTVVTRPADARFDRPLSGLYWQASFETGERLRSRSLWDFVIDLPADPRVDDQLHHHSVPGPGEQNLYLIQRHVELPTRLGTKRVRVAVGLSEADVSAAVWRFARALLPLLAFLGALLIAAAWMQVTFGLRPLASIRSRITKIRSGKETRLGTDFPSEVQPLAHEIDTLLEAREKQIETSRLRAQDLAHGLKTSLQVLFGGIGRLKAIGEEAIGDDLESAALMMQRHVDRQLARARIQSGKAISSASVEDAARRVVRVLERTLEGSRLTWSIDVPAEAAVAIDADDLAEALGGLAENAARFARSRVVLGAEVNDRTVAITVSDDGPGIPEESFALVRERGGRLDTAGGGAGLGLAIVSDIAEAWGGELDLAHGDGSFTVSLRLPRAAEPATDTSPRK